MLVCGKLRQVPYIQIPFCVPWKALAIVLPALLSCLCPIAALACFQTLNDWPEMLNDVVFFNLWNLIWHAE